MIPLRDMASSDADAAVNAWVCWATFAASGDVSLFNDSKVSLNSQMRSAKCTAVAAVNVSRTWPIVSGTLTSSGRMRYKARGAANNAAAIQVRSNIDVSLSAILASPCVQGPGTYFSDVFHRHVW